MLGEESSQSGSESSTQDYSFRQPLIPIDNLLSGNEGSRREPPAPEKEAEFGERQPVPEVVETPKTGA